jgi:hypothetical protein
MTTHDANMRRRAAFFTDFENSCLSDFEGVIPVGRRRHLDPEWARHIRGQVYPHHSDITWEQYCAFVESGGGDEWFFATQVDAAAEEALTSSAGCAENPDG